MRRVHHYRFLLALPLAGINVYAAHQAQDEPLEQLIVTGHANVQLSSTGSAADRLSSQGVDFSSAGGISSLPVLRGLNDDRIKLLIDGAETTSACANHMNPALSYIDASRIHSVDVIAGITPVSAGGDSIGGTIVISSEPLVYAKNSNAVLSTGSVGYFYRSNSYNHGAALKAGIASDRASLSYSGSHDKADSYRDGDGDKVLDTLYKSESHTLTMGIRGDSQAVSLKLTHQKVPYQGFPNQYMDMVENTSYGVNFNYLRDFSWGKLDTRINWQKVDHEMGFFSAEKPGTMPMITEGRDLGYKIAATIPYGNDATLRLGNEYHQFNLDDWWPAVAGSMMMGPDDYKNINDGERTRYALYAESENNFGKRWQALVGLRYEHVVMDSGDVQPYSSMSGMMSMNLDAPAADAFNARSHRRNDDNIDVTLLGTYTLRDDKSVEFGYARKTRSPNLYERFSWGRGTMAMTMIGWFGDGNGYVGSIDLNPEVAHTVGATFNWHKNEDNLLSVSPYYTYVDDYIDAHQVSSFNPRAAMAVTRPLLQFTNLDARMYGVEIQTRKQILRNNDDRLVLETRLSYTRGERSEDGGDLYHIIPLNVKMALEYVTESWTNRLEVQWVDDKDKVDSLRLENSTASYALVNFQAAYQWQQVTLSAGISNLLDRQYDLPLGGVYLSGWLQSDRTGPFNSLSGEGRSVDIGLQYAF